MIEMKQIKEDYLRVKHEAEILAAKSPETDLVQNSQDEAIAAIYEMVLALFTDENGDPLTILSEAAITEICKKQIDKSVANKVNTTVKKAKTEIVEEITALIDQKIADALSALEAPAEEVVSEETEAVLEETEVATDETVTETTPEENTGEEVVENA